MSNEIEISLKSKIAYLLPEQELKKVILDDIMYAVSYINTLKSKDILSFEVIELSKEILQFPTLRIDEIRIAFRCGLNGEFGEYFGLNVKTYVGWIKSYVTSEKRHMAIKNDHIKQLPEKKLTDKDLENIFVSAFNFSESYFKKNGVVLDKGNAIFDGLWKRGLIKMTPEETLQSKEDALFEMTGNLNMQINQPCVNSEDFALKKQLEKKIEEISINHPEVISLAKDKILEQFFKK